MLLFCMLESRLSMTTTTRLQALLDHLIASCRAQPPLLQQFTVLLQHVHALSSTSLHPIGSGP